MNWAQDISLEWAVALIVAFPAAMLAANELLHRALRRGSPLTPALKSTRNLLIPAAGLAAMISLVLRLSPSHPISRLSLTVFWTAVLYVALQFVSDIVFGAARPGSWRATVPSLFRDLVRSLLVGVGAALIYSNIWGQELAGALTALGVGSLVIGLALQEPLGNVFSGLMLLFEHPVAIGDWIRVDGKTGRVLEMNWRAVNIVTMTQETIVVPNSSLYKTSFENLSRPTPLRIVNLEMAYSYNDPPNRVKEVLTAIAKSIPSVLAEPTPVVRTAKYGDFSISYEVFFAVANQESVPLAKDDFMTRIWYASQRANLTIPYPIQTEIGASPADFTPPVPSAGEVLAGAPRFTGSAGATVQMKMLRFSQGEAMLTEGDEQDGLCLIVEGKAALMATPNGGGAPVEIGLLSAGDYYGEHSLLAGSPSSTAIVALSDVQAALFDLESARRLVEASPRLARDIGDTIDQRRNAVDAVRRKRAAGAGAG